MYPGLGKARSAIKLPPGRPEKVPVSSSCEFRLDGNQMISVIAVATPQVLMLPLIKFLDVPGLSLRRHDELPGLGGRVIWADPDFHRAPQRIQPSGEFVDGDTFHAPAKDFGKCGLIGAAKLRRFLLRETPLLDGKRPVLAV